MSARSSRPKRKFAPVALASYELDIQSLMSSYAKSPFVRLNDKYSTPLDTVNEHLSTFAIHHLRWPADRLAAAYKHTDCWILHIVTMLRCKIITEQVVGKSMQVVRGIQTLEMKTETIVATKGASTAPTAPLATTATTTNDGGAIASIPSGDLKTHENVGNVENAESANHYSQLAAILPVTSASSLPLPTLPPSTLPPSTLPPSTLPPSTIPPSTVISGASSSQPATMTPTLTAASPSTDSHSSRLVDLIQREIDEIRMSMKMRRELVDQLREKAKAATKEFENELNRLKEVEVQLENALQAQKLIMMPPVAAAAARIAASVSASSSSSETHMTKEERYKMIVWKNDKRTEPDLVLTAQKWKITDEKGELLVPGRFCSYCGCRWTMSYWRFFEVDGKRFRICNEHYARHLAFLRNAPKGSKIDLKSFIDKPIPWKPKQNLEESYVRRVISAHERKLANKADQKKIEAKETKHKESETKEGESSDHDSDWDPEPVDSDSEPKAKRPKVDSSSKSGKKSKPSEKEKKRSAIVNKSKQNTDKTNSDTDSE